MNRKKNRNPNKNLMDMLHNTLSVRGMKLADVANILGISYIHMASLSNGARQISGLKLDKQRKLAAFLGITMVDFLLMSGVLRQEDLIKQ